jgi:hypothetical protein
MSPKRPRWIFYLLFSSFAVALAFSTYLLVNALAAASFTNTGPYPPPSSPGVAARPPISLCATLYPVNPDLTSDKRAIEERDYKDCMDALNSPPPTLELTPRPLPTNAPTIVANIPRRRAGAGTILETGLAPFPSYYRISNQWYMEKGGKIIRVFAGAQKGDGAKNLDKPWPGILIVVVSTTDNNNYFPSEGGTYQTPVRAGLVHIVDANGMRLTLVSESGQVFVFDVSTREFIPQKPDAKASYTAGAGRIVESGVPPIPLPEDTFTNQWYEDKDGYRITVLAGNEVENDRQGVIVVITTSQDQQEFLSKETYLAPIPLGPLQIFDVDSEKITATAGERIFVFDVASHKFITWPDVEFDPLPPTSSPLVTPSISSPTSILPSTPSPYP